MKIQSTERLRNETSMTKLADKDRKTAAIHTLNMCNSLKANINIIREKQNIKMNHVEHLETETKILLYRNNCRLNSAEEKIVNLTL